MGNNVMTSVIKIFDRSHLEIDSISAKIDREKKVNGRRERHEICVENNGIFRNCADTNDRNMHNQVHKWRKRRKIVQQKKKKNEEHKKRKIDPKVD